MSLVVLESVNPAVVGEEGQFVTFVHLSSESSDHYYLAFKGIHAWQEVLADVEENWETLGVDIPECMHVESVLCVQVA